MLGLHHKIHSYSNNCQISFAFSRKNQPGANDRTSKKTQYFYMDEKVQGNIAKLLVSLGLAENLGQAMEFEDRVTVYAKIGQRYIDIKVWAIDGYIS